MKTSRKRLAQGLLALSLGFGLAAVPALADDDDCDVPVKQWQSREAVLRLATRQGWQVQRLKIDDGCYELRGIDAQGREFKAKLDPLTLRVVKLKQRDRDRDGQRSGPAVPAEGAAPPNTATPATTPHLTPGTAPRGQIE